MLRISFLTHTFPRLSSAALISGLLLLSGSGGLLSPTSVLALTAQIPQGGNSAPVTADYTFTENSIGAFPSSGGTLIVSIVDSMGGHTVHFSGSPCVSAPGSLAETIAVAPSGNSFTLTFASSDPFNVEHITVSCMYILADANAALGDIKTQLTGSLANDATMTATPFTIVGGAGKLVITKFDDANGNGVKNPGEALLPGFDFTVTDANGSVTPATTGANGTVSIGLPAGNTTVTENTPPSPWVQTAPLPLGPQTVTITTGQTTTVAFGNHNGPVPGTLCILKFNDLDGQGDQDLTDPLLSGWTFNIHQTSGGPTTSITTGPTVGIACGHNPVSASDSLSPGTYTVSEVIPLVPLGWTQTAPLPIGPQTVTIASGQTSLLVFGNHRAFAVGSAVPVTPSPTVSLAPSPSVSTTTKPTAFPTHGAGASNPTSTAPPPEFTMIAAGGNNTCDIFGDAVHCWGNNQFGQTGTGDQITPQPNPVTAVASGATAVATSGKQTCAIVNGAVECWGNQQYYGTSTAQLAPVPVPNTSGATAVATGEDFACAIVASAVKCWGRNLEGEIGNGQGGNNLSTGYQPIPVTVLGITSGATAISASRDHACAIVAGAVKCWGYNQYGQLGYGQLGNGQYIYGGYANWQPNPVTAIWSGATAIAAGWNFTCAIVNGTVMCWGSNYFGQVVPSAPVQTGQNSLYLSPVTVLGNTAGATTIAAGRSHACAIVSGAVECWGFNYYGQTSNGNTASSQLTPVTAIASGATALAAGWGHTCAIVNGTVMCWGWNSNGQLGDGTLVDQHSPIAVPGLAVAPSNQAVASDAPSANRTMAPAPPSSDPLIPMLIVVVLMVGLAVGAGLWLKGRATP